MTNASPAAERFHESSLSASTYRYARLFRRHQFPGNTIELPEFPQELIERGKPLIQKQCFRTTVLTEWADSKMVVKRYVERSWRHRFKRMFLPSRASRVFQDTCQLIDADIPTPKPIAYYELTWFQLRGPVSFYLYEYLPGQTLEQAVRKNLDDRAYCSHLKEQVYRLFARLKQIGVVLHDPWASNFIVDQNDQMWVIDLDRLKRYPARSKRLDRAVLRSQQHFEDSWRVALRAPDAAAVRAA